jgi:hypothetical protein
VNNFPIQQFCSLIKENKYLFKKNVIKVYFENNYPMGTHATMKLKRRRKGFALIY